MLLSLLVMYSAKVSMVTVDCKLDKLGHHVEEVRPPTAVGLVVISIMFRAAFTSA